MLVVLMVEELFLLHLLFFGVVHILLDFLAVGSFIVHDLLLLLLFLRLMQQCYLSLLVQFHLVAKLLLALCFHIPSALIEYFARPLASCLDLLEGARLLTLEQLDAIGQQTQVILRTFSSEFGSHQFLVQRCIVVFFIGRQVDVLVLLAVVVLLLLIAVHVLARTAHSSVDELLLVLIVVVLAAIGVTVWRLLVIVVQIVLHIIKNYCL